MTYLCSTSPATCWGLKTNSRFPSQRKCDHLLGKLQMGHSGRWEDKGSCRCRSRGGGGGLLSNPESRESCRERQPPPFLPEVHLSLGLGMAPELGLVQKPGCSSLCPSRRELDRQPADRGWPGLAPLGTRIWITVGRWAHLKTGGSQGHSGHT